jgi:hypothetical protein
MTVTVGLWSGTHPIATQIQDFVIQWDESDLNTGWCILFFCGTHSLRLEPLHRPLFVKDFFEVSQTICLGWFPTMTLLIFVSWAARITVWATGAQLGCGTHRRAYPLQAGGLGPPVTAFVSRRAHASLRSTALCMIRGHDYLIQKKVDGTARQPQPAAWRVRQSPLKHWIHFLLSSLWPPTSNMLWKATGRWCDSGHWQAGTQFFTFFLCSQCLMGTVSPTGSRPPNYAASVPLLSPTAWL